MSTNLPEYPTNSSTHSLEVERRLTRAETTGDNHEARITYLERALQVMIWVIGALATSKTGDVAELVLSLAKLKQ